MGLGILQPKDGHHVPGTVNLDEAAGTATVNNSHLKHGTGKNSHIVLVPQPSDDPNDPLNWSTMKKSIVMTIILMGTTFVCIVPTPMLNAGIVPISADLGRSFTDIAKLSGYMALVLGGVSPIASAFSRKYGKRPVFVVSSVVGLVGCLVAEFSPNYGALTAGRVLQGAGASAYESLCISVIGDLYFVHERGFYVAVVIFFLSALSNGVSVLAGVITTKLGWPFNFHILLPFLVSQTILVILFAPETAFIRSNTLNIDRTGSNSDLSEKKENNSGIDHVEEIKEPAHDAEVARGSNAPRSKSYWQQLSLYNGTFTDKSLFSMFIASIAIMFNVVASYNVFLTGLIMAWFVAMSVLAGVMFAGPPWNFDAATIGYASSGPLIGGSIASIVLAYVNDPVIRYMTRRNHGVYEPEFRLVLTVFGAIFTIGGLAGFGHAIGAGQSIYGIATLWGVTLFGMAIFASVTSGYALDAMPAHSVEIFIFNVTFKNFFFYGVTDFIVPWYMKSGAAKLFDIIAGISAGLFLLTVPMYIFGKRYRQHWSRHNILVWMGVDEDPHASK
ncbi:hypothetical protein FSOLCH5_006495 [Fusarium solani]|nr:hypothetical protein NW759_012349 [Fusarium solani]